MTTMADDPNPVSVADKLPLLINQCNEKTVLLELTIPLCSQQISGKKFAQSKKDIIKALVLFSLLFLFGYQMIYNSEWVLHSETERIGVAGIDEAINTNSGLLYWDQPIKVMKLSSEYIPKIGKMIDHRRLIIIGDVHGMKHSLEHLLENVEYNGTRDHLIFVGDLVSKGPDSAGVVDLAMNLGATCVLGNHEDQVIRAWNHLHSGQNSSDDATQVEVARKLYKPKDKALAMALGKDRIEWMKTWPMILRLENMGAMREVLIAHAGIDPNLTLKHQNPYLVMNMRSFRHGVFTKTHRGKIWAKKWNNHQKSLHKNERRMVIYGHDAKRGLMIKRYSMGIDSACFKGKKLTAALIKSDGLAYTYEIAQVKCKIPYDENIIREDRF